jgi:hypothetical protein
MLLKNCHARLDIAAMRQFLTKSFSAYRRSRHKGTSAAAKKSS